MKNQPCRCLWRGLALQITRTTFLRLMTLQDSHMRLTEARTFIKQVFRVLKSEIWGKNSPVEVSPPARFTLN